MQLVLPAGEMKLQLRVAAAARSVAMKRALALLLALSATAYAGPQQNDDEDPLGKPAPKRPDVSKPEPKKPEPKKPEAKKPEVKPDVDDDAPARQPDKKKAKKKPIETKKAVETKKKPVETKPAVEVDDDVPPPHVSKKPDEPKKATRRSTGRPRPRRSRSRWTSTSPRRRRRPRPPRHPTPVVVAPLDEPAGPKRRRHRRRQDRRSLRARHAPVGLQARVAYVKPLSTSRPIELADVDGPGEPRRAERADRRLRRVGQLGDDPGADHRLQAARPRWSLETVLGVPFTVKFQATGTLANKSIAPTALGIPTGVRPLGPDLGEAKAAPPLVTLVYSLARSAAPIQPYVGAGAAVLIAYNAKVTNPMLTEVSQPTCTISPAPGLVLQAGLEARLYEALYARLDVKFIALMLANATVEHIQVKTPDLPLFDTVEVGTAKMSVWVNPLIIQAGIGTDF